MSEVSRDSVCGLCVTLVGFASLEQVTTQICRLHVGISVEQPHICVCGLFAFFKHTFFCTCAGMQLNIMDR